MYTEQLQKGDSYINLKKCIHVSILNFVYFREDEECYRKIHFREDQSGRLYTDVLEIQVMELPKLKGEFPDNDDVYCWMKFFSGKSREEFKQMAKTNEYLDEAYQQLQHLSADEVKRMEYEAREKAIRDHNAMMETALEQGMQQGSVLRMISIIRKKRIRGCSVLEIADALEEEESIVQKIVDNIEAHPDWNDRQLLTLLPFQISEAE
jgi:predicted transposase/invertase (TIGR01784 family)